jgi:hypothetical protein
MFGKRNACIVLNKNNSVARQQQVRKASIPPLYRFGRQKHLQKLYNSGF